MKTFRVMSRLFQILLVVAVVVGPAHSLLAQDARPVDVNKAVVRRLLTEVLNAGDASVIEEVVTHDFVGHDPLGSGSIHGLAGMTELVGSLRSMLSEFHVTEVAMVAEGDMVSCLTITQGRFTEAWGGYLPNGASIRYTGNTLYRLEDGKIVEAWFVSDTLALMQQLTAPPADPTLYP